MQFLEIGCRNFLSFEEERVDLSQQGLVLVKGHNADSFVANNNGAGKSALFVDLWVWTIWGKSPRGLTPAKITHRDHRDVGAVGWLAFEDGGKVYGISRYQNHSTEGNALYFAIIEEGESLPWTKDIIRKKESSSTKSDKRDTQTAISSTIGLSHGIALNAIVLGQNGISFAGMTDAVKKATLEEILEFAVFTAAEKRARARVANIQTQVNTNNSLLTRLSVQATELKGRLKSNQTQEADWNNRRSAEVERQKALLEKSREALAIQQKIHDDAATELAFLEKGDLANASTTLEAVEYNIRNVESEEIRARTGVASLQGRVATLESQIIPEVCSACGQSIRPENINQARAAKEAQLATLRAELEVAVESLQQVQEHLSAHRESGKLWKDYHERSSARYRELSVAKTTAAPQVATLAAQVKSLEDALTRPEINPFTLAVAQTARDIAGVEAQSVELEASNAQLEDDKLYLEFWERGFGKKGIQSYLLDEVVPFLNERCNVYADIVFGEEATIEFRTQKASEDGRSVKEEFHVVCINNFGSDVYEGNSGGERERADICVALTLQDLVISRLGRQFNLCILDEVGRHIDSTGVELYYRVLELLAAERSTVFVITHSPALESLFTHVWTVEKRNRVSKLRREAV
jgi:DNA repair exonuclease SbcCD ATPase subunit